MSYSDNPLTQLPTVDFNFEDLRKRMTEFTVKFDAFIEQGRKRVLQERNEFRARLGEISGKHGRYDCKKPKTDNRQRNNDLATPKYPRCSQHFQPMIMS
jgi:hypothetical protein